MFYLYFKHTEFRQWYTTLPDAKDWSTTLSDAKGEEDRFNNFK